MRALQEALGIDLQQIAERYGPSQKTYREIADEWQGEVLKKFPDFKLTFGAPDVYRVFERHGVRTEAITSGAGNAPG